MNPVQAALLDCAGVVFDLDGVILDSEPVHLEVANSILPEDAAPIQWDDYEQFIGLTDPVFYGWIRETYSLSPSVEELIRLYKDRLTVYYDTHHIDPEPGVTELLELLRANGRKLAIASASTHVNINAALKATGLGEFFPVRVSSEDVAHGKPEPDVYLEAARILGLEPGKLAAVEDSDPGCEAARRAGYSLVVGYRNPNSGAQTLGQATIVTADFERIGP